MEEAHKDKDSLADLVEDAMCAFGVDVSYGVAMVRSAVFADEKREAWVARSELHKAEAEARALCAQAVPFLCTNSSPCGTGGSCKFARGDLVLLEVSRCPGTTPRPQQSMYDAYNIEAAVNPLKAMRKEQT